MRIPWQFVVLGAFAVAGGMVLALQRQAAEELRGEIALQCEEGRDLNRLRADNQRLKVAQVSAVVLESLRADHAAIARMRGEVEAAKRHAAELTAAAGVSPARSAPAQSAVQPSVRPAGPVPVAAEDFSANRDPEKGMTRPEFLKDAGWATPGTAFQTMIWAAVQQRDDLLKGAFALDDVTRQKAEALFAAVPSELREKYSTAEGLIGHFFAAAAVQDLRGLHVLGQEPGDAQHVTLHVKMQGDDEEDLPMKLGPAGWQLVLPPEALDELKAQLMPSPGGTSPGK